MTKKTVLCTLALLVFVCFALSAVAADRNFIISGRTAIVKHPGKVTPNAWRDAKLATISGNLSDFPYGVYFSLYNYYLTGSNNTIGVAEYWQAVPFTPSANIKVMEVDASVVYAEGTNEIILALYKDSNGLPGTAMKTWKVKNLASFGTCCQLAVGKSKAGIAVSKGTQYWLVAKTDSSDSDVFAGWDLNSTDMRSHPLATYCSGTSQQCGTGNNAWSGGNAILPGYAVMGK